MANKTTVKGSLLVLSVISFTSLAIAAVSLGMSMSSSVIWNVYNDYYQNGTEIYFFHTLTTYWGQGLVIDATKVEAFKAPIFDKLKIAIGTICGAALCVIVGITASAVTKRKLVITVPVLLSIGLGITGGYFSLSAWKTYREGLPETVSLVGGQTFIFDMEMIRVKLGYDLPLISAVISIVASALLCVYLVIYIGCGDSRLPKEDKVAPEDGMKDEKY